MGVEGFLVVADVEHGVDGGNIDELARRLIHLIHRVGEVLSRPDDDGYDFVFQQFGKHLVDDIIGIVKLFTDFDVAQVDDMELRPVVEKRIKGFSNRVHAISAAFIVDRAAFFLDTDDGQIHTFEVWEIVLVAVDINGLAQGFLTRTKSLAETLIRNRVKENADVHSFWLMAYDYGLWPMTASPKCGFTPLVEASHRPSAISHS